MGTTIRISNVAPTEAMWWEIVEAIGSGSVEEFRERIASLPTGEQDVYGFRRSDEDELVRAAAESVPPGLELTIRSMTISGRTRTNVKLGEKLNRNSFEWQNDSPESYSISIRRGSFTTAFDHYSYGSVSVTVDTTVTIFDEAQERAVRERESKVLDQIEVILGRYLVPQPPRPPFRVVLGHGNDHQWRILRDELRDHHGFAVDAFEGQPRAGETISGILEQMAASASAALVILTRADAMKDGTWRARQNVIHEVGFFQGRLGWSNAIAVVEDGVDLFSNLDGTQQIRFPRGNIASVTGQVAATLNLKKRAFGY